MGKKPRIRKLGTIDCDMVETTPIVFRGRLYRFEYVRSNYKPNTTGDTYFRFIDVATGRATAPFANGFHLGSAHVQDEIVYVYGVDRWGGSTVQVFWSKDLAHWASQSALSLPGWAVYNNSVCRAPRGYVMALELGEPPEIVGVPFTMRFAQSADLLHWTLLGDECVYSKDRYTACPALRYLDGFYYMIYLEAYDGPSYMPHIVRTEDFVTWQSSPFNPVLHFSDEDKRIAKANLSPQQRSRIAQAVNINNSDVDLCEFEGRVIINYSWGDQQGTEFLAEAVCEAPLPQFLPAWFPAGLPA